MKLKTFGPYGLMPRVGEKMEEEFNGWMEGKELSVKDIAPLTASLPDRTSLVLIFYSDK